MVNDDFRETHEANRAAGLVKRHETRLGWRTHSVPGIDDQQAIVQPYGRRVRLRVADETGESFAAVILDVEGTQELVDALLAVKAIVEESE